MPIGNKLLEIENKALNEHLAYIGFSFSSIFDAHRFIMNFKDIETQINNNEMEGNLKNSISKEITWKLSELLYNCAELGGMSVFSKLK